MSVTCISNEHVTALGTEPLLAAGTVIEGQLAFWLNPVVLTDRSSKLTAVGFGFSTLMLPVTMKLLGLSHLVYVVVYVILSVVLASEMVGLAGDAIVLIFQLTTGP